jgi:hypothetical protein
MTVLSGIALFLIVSPSAQEGMAPPAPPAEMKKLDFMMGTWTGKETMHSPDGKSVMLDGTVVLKRTMGGMWIQETHKSVARGQTFLDAEQLTTYDARTKKWKGWWFDNSMPMPIEMTGTLTGNTMVTLSRAVAMPGMPGNVTVRTTMTKKSERSITMKVEMQTQGKWSTLISASYQKA